MVAFTLCQCAIADDGPVTPYASPGLEQARDAIESERYQDAVKMLEEIFATNKRDADVFNLLGFSYRKLGNLARARMFYDEAIAISPAHLGANEYLGELFLQIGDIEAAKANLEVLRKACGDCEEFVDLQEAIRATQNTQ